MRAWDEWLRTAREALSDCDDQTERMIRVVAAVKGSRTRASKRADQPDEILPPMLLPDVLGDRKAHGWWWDHDAVQEWFLRSVKAPPENLTVVDSRRTLFGGRKRIQTNAPGWSFQGGATASTGELGTPTHFVFNVSILKDGRRMIGAAPDPSAGFNGRTLTQMAAMAELTPLPPPPPMSYFHPEASVPIWPA
jgi:hypothetical protein